MNKQQSASDQVIQQVTNRHVLSCPLVHQYDVVQSDKGTKRS
jgi:hypothetical protein